MGKALLVLRLGTKYQQYHRLLPHPTTPQCPILLPLLPNLLPNVLPLLPWSNRLQPTNLLPLLHSHQAAGHSPNKKGGRRAKFTPSDDIIIVREVSAAKAHIAVYGEIQKRFTDAAAKANSNKQLSQKVTAKSIQDRYKKIQDVFNQKDTAERRLSGVGGEIGELDELLGMMQEARKDMEKEKKAVTTAQEEREGRKEHIGRELVARSLARKNSTAGDGGNDEEDDEGEDGSGSDRGRERKKRRTNTHNAHEGELEGFGLALKEADLARVELEQSRLTFARERFEADREDREKDRALRREEREASNALEVEKFKMLMGAVMQFQK